MNVRRIGHWIGRMVCSIIEAHLREYRMPETPAPMYLLRWYLAFGGTEAAFNEALLEGEDEDEEGGQPYKPEPGDVIIQDGIDDVHAVKPDGRTHDLTW